MEIIAQLDESLGMPPRAEFVEALVAVQQERYKPDANKRDRFGIAGLRTSSIRKQRSATVAESLLIGYGVFSIAMGCWRLIMPLERIPLSDRLPSFPVRSISRCQGGLISRERNGLPRPQ